MKSSLGIYVGKSFIKYAKLQEDKGSIKLVAFNVVFYENLLETLMKIIRETNSLNISIKIFISDELENAKRIKEIISRNEILKRNIKFEISISKSIVQLLKPHKNENVAIVNIEDKTQITIITGGEICQVSTLQEGMSEIIDKLSEFENSTEKIYEICKNLIIAENIGVLDDDDNVYIEHIKPILYKIVTKTKQILEDFYSGVTRIYITGSGANMNNIDLYFQEYILNIECEFLKPFFLEMTSIKTSIKDYIEVNSAISLALEGLGYSFEYFKDESQKNSQLKVVSSKEKFIRKKLSVGEKTMLRVCVVIVILIAGLLGFSNEAYNTLNERRNKITEISKQIENEITLMDKDLNKINSKIDEYTRIIKNVRNLTEVEKNEQSSRIISKYAIPNMLNKIMNLIPEQVKIISIANQENTKYILITAESEKYEQLGYFSSILKTENVLKNIKSTSGSKEGDIVRVTIEGELP